MTNRRTDIVGSSRQTRQVHPEGNQGGASANAALRTEAAAGLIKLLVHGGHLYLDATRMEIESNRDWEDTRRRIAELDASTQAELKKLEAQLSGQKEKTLRLRMVLDVIATRGDTLSDVFAKGLAVAVEQLTQE